MKRTGDQLSYRPFNYRYPQYLWIQNPRIWFSVGLKVASRKAFGSTLIWPVLVLSPLLCSSLVTNWSGSLWVSTSCVKVASRKVFGSTLIWPVLVLSSLLCSSLVKGQLPLLGLSTQVGLHCHIWSTPHPTPHPKHPDSPSITSGELVPTKTVVALHKHTMSGSFVLCLFSALLAVGEYSSCPTLERWFPISMWKWNHGGWWWQAGCDLMCIPTKPSLITAETVSVGMFGIIRKLSISMCLEESRDLVF